MMLCKAFECFYWLLVFSVIGIVIAQGIMLGDALEVSAGCFVLLMAIGSFVYTRK